MRVGVVGDNFREDRAFRVKLSSGIEGLAAIEGVYPNLKALRSLEDSSGIHYRIKPRGRIYKLERQVSGTLVNYEIIGIIRPLAA